MLNGLDLQLLATLAYSAQFNFPLTLNETRHKLLSLEAVNDLAEGEGELGDLLDDLVKADNSEIVSVDDVEKRLAKLMKWGLVKQQSGFYFLKTRQENAVATREQKAVASTALRRGLVKLVGLALDMRWVRAVGVTGSVAVDGAAEQDDTDLLLVTANNRLWLVRAAILFYALLLGKKAWPWQRRKSAWCFNLWLEEDVLKLPTKQHSLYGALESRQIFWLLDKSMYQQRFFQENAWLGRYLASYNNSGLVDVAGANVTLQKTQRILPDKSVNSGLLQTLFSRILSGINLVCYLTARRHLHQKNAIPLGNLQPHQAFLHDDVSFKQYLDRCRDHLLQVIVPLRKGTRS